MLLVTATLRATVPQPPHKKKPKLQVMGSVGMAESRRSSGLSETSSEVDSAAESPDLNEVTSESLVSNKVNMLSVCFL